MWFKEMTDKAENLLNQMDKTAASAFQKSKNGTQFYSKANVYPEESSPPFQEDLSISREKEDINLNGTEMGNEEIFNKNINNSLLLENKFSPSINLINEAIINGSPNKKNSPQHEEKPLFDIKDLQETLALKESQLSLLGARLQGAEEKLSKISFQLEDKTKDTLKILEDQERSACLSKQLQESLQSRIEELEIQLKREQEISTQIKASSLKQMERLEDEKLHLTESYHQLERKLDSEKSKNQELSNQLNLTQDYMESLKQELEDYKNKARSVLHSKEKLISSLQTHGSSPSTISTPTLENIEDFTEEISTLRRELSGVKQALSDTQALVATQQLELDTQRQEIWKRDKQITEKKTALEKIEQECQQLKQSAQYYHEDFLQMKTRFELQIKERDEQIERLRKQLMTKSLNSTSQEELEARLHNLTEALIQKQTLVEALSSEKSSLILQLERVKQKQEEHTSSTIQIPDSELKLRGSSPPLDLLHPGSGVTNRVKKAYNVLDKVGARFALFLGRHPYIRPAFLIYIVLLHAWVLVVLLTYTPEIHS